MCNIPKFQIMQHFNDDKAKVEVEAVKLGQPMTRNNHKIEMG